MPSFPIPHFLLRSYSHYDSRAACMRAFVRVKNGIHATGTSHCGYFFFFYHSLFIFPNKHFSKHSHIFLLESVRFMSTIHPLIFFSPIPLFYSFFCCFSVWYMGPACQASCRFPPVSVISAFLFRFLLFFTVVHQLKGTWLNLSLPSFSPRALYHPPPSPSLHLLSSPVATEWSKSGNQFDVIMTNESRWLAGISRACASVCVHVCVWGEGCWEITN